MRKGTVTGEIKSILNKLNIKYTGCYSDTYNLKEGDDINLKRVGVKFIGVYLTQEQINIIKDKMSEKGFMYDFIKENRGKSLYGTNGTRFCFKY
jgi:hypothetical protein